MCNLECFPKIQSHIHTSCMHVYSIQTVPIQIHALSITHSLLLLVLHGIHTVQRCVQELILQCSLFVVITVANFSRPINWHLPCLMLPKKVQHRLQHVYWFTRCRNAPELKKNTTVYIHIRI